jgi:hypothetical protein
MLVVAAATAGLVAAAAPPASAHWYARRINGPFPQSYGLVFMNEAHTRVKVCDDVYDNTGVWVEFYYQIDGVPHTSYGTVHDSNGAGNSCAEWWLPPASYFVGIRGRYGVSGVDTSGWNWGDY